MSRPPADYSADGKWWWDGEQWQPAQGRPPDSGITEVSEANAGTRRILRFTIAVFVTGALIALATAIWPPGARLSLPYLHRGAPGSTSSPATPSSGTSQHQQAQRYRQVVATGAQQLNARIDAVTSSCTTPANLAVCRAALVSLRGAELDYRAQLDSVGAPACLTPADGQLKHALDLLGGGAGQAVAGIDRQDPGQIVTSVQLIQQAGQNLDSARQQVDAASC